MSWFGTLCIAVLFAYLALPLWAHTKGELLPSDLITLFGAPLIWFVLMGKGISHVASLSNLFLEGLIVIPTAPLLLALRLFLLNRIWRDQGMTSCVIAIIAMGAAVALRLIMPTMPE